jgi:hypothetical protein
VNPNQDRTNASKLLHEAKRMILRTDAFCFPRYNADQVWTGNGSNWDRTVDYVYAADKLNRTSMNDNGSATNYATSAMNQYVVNGAAYNYDGNFTLASAPNSVGGFDAQNRLMSAAHGWDNAFFTYDGLGRCVRRVVYAPNGSSDIVLYTYDGWKPVEEWDGAGNFHGLEHSRGRSGRDPVVLQRQRGSFSLSS